MRKDLIFAVTFTAKFLGCYNDTLHNNLTYASDEQLIAVQAIATALNTSFTLEHAGIFLAVNTVNASYWIDSKGITKTI